MFLFDLKFKSGKPVLSPLHIGSNTKHHTYGTSYRIPQPQPKHEKAVQSEIIHACF